MVLGHLREAEGLRGQLSPVATDLFSLLCGHARGVRSQCFLPVSDGHHGRLRQRACWAQEVVSVAVLWRSVSVGPWAQGADSSGTACHVCCDPAALPPSLSPFWKEEPGGFRQAPAQADCAFLSQECPFLWGLYGGGRGRVALLPLPAPGPGGWAGGSAPPSGSWARRPVLFPGSDFNTLASCPSPFICKDGSLFSFLHCSLGP